MLPSDLRKVSVKRKVKKAIELLLATVIVLGGYCSLELNTPSEKVSIIILALFLLGIVLLKKIPDIIDKSFLGEVVEVTIKTGVEMEWLFKRPWTQPRRNTIVLRIQLINGKHISRQVYCEQAEVYSKQEKMSPNIDKYSVGDKVFHLSGTQHTIVLPKPSDDVVQCAVCGSYVNINKEICPHCSHSLVKRMF